ncbi:MAG: F0F1 ATP synthase subunit epsilon [Minwuia sp.]|nr:F0F1 ATP synthase subunit epsilon [Minwuia sp.]
MADRIQFELVSPARLLTSMEVDMIVVPGTEGDFAVLPGHMPVVSTLRPGAVDVFVGGTDKPSERFFVAGGFAEVALDTFTVLAETAIPMGDLDRSHLEQEIANTREDIEDARSDEDRQASEERLSQLEDMLNSLAEFTRV